MRDFLFPGVMRRLSSAKKDTHRQIQELVFSQTSLKIYGSKETMVQRRWESMAGNLVLTTELKT